MAELDQNSQIAAIHAMSDLSTTMVNMLWNDVKSIKHEQSKIADAVAEINTLTKILTQKIMELSMEIHRVSSHLPAPTADALTAPLIAMQENSERRKRERSGTTRRIYGDGG